MRITCLIDSLVSGGAQRQLCTLAILFKKAGHDVSVLTYHPTSFYLPLLRDAGVEYQCIQSKSKLARIWSLRRSLRSDPQDVVLAFLDGPCLYAEMAALPRRKWGLVVSERLALPEEGRGRLWKRRLHRLADYVTTNSHTNRFQVEAAVPKLQGRVVTIYNALDLDYWSPAETPQETRQEGVLRLVVAARHEPQKNSLGLVDALDIVRRTNPDLLVHVDWYGFDPFETRTFTGWSPLQATREKIKSLSLGDYFTIHPDTRDIREKYRQADAVILPSYFEGLPNTICEAMGCARPILLSNVCDAENLVLDGESGLLFDPHSSADIARAICAMAQLPVAERAKMGAKARVTAQTLFDPAIVTDKYLEVLRAAAERRTDPIDHWISVVPPSARRPV